MARAFHGLDPNRVISTIETLGRRIHERFPASELEEVCAELGQIARDSRDKAAWIARPNTSLRVCVAALILVSVVALVYSVSQVQVTIGSFDAGELLQVTEAGMNNVVLIGAAIFFLVTIETRIKRSRALQALDELRAIAHVIDMHQLTKDPSGSEHVPTPSSPSRNLTPFLLTRYLDYCSEMFSMTGKVAALYAQDFRDATVLAAVNEIETLTTGLSRKVWQKIVILKTLTPAQDFPNL